MMAVSHRWIVKNQRIALLAAATLLAMFVGDAGAMHRFQPDDLGYPGIAQSHPWRLEASAPSKTWESPSLHQGIRKKAPPATTDIVREATAPTAIVSIDHAIHSSRSSVQLPRLVSPRAPPQHSIAL